MLLLATTTQSTITPGIFTCREFNVSDSASRSTCAITMPPELRAAIAIDKPFERQRFLLHRDVAVTSAVVPRTIATSIGKVL